MRVDQEFIGKLEVDEHQCEAIFLTMQAAYAYDTHVLFSQNHNGENLVVFSIIKYKRNDLDMRAYGPIDSFACIGHRDYSGALMDLNPDGYTRVDEYGYTTREEFDAELLRIMRDSRD